MRIHSAVAILVVLLTCFGAIPARARWQPAGPTPDPLPVGSVWVGTQEQENRDGALTIVLCVQSRLDNTFQATVWLPGWGNGLMSVGGRLEKKSVVTLDFQKVVYGKNLVEGVKTEGTIKNGVLKCEGKFQATPEDVIVTKYTLKQVE